MNEIKVDIRDNYNTGGLEIWVFEFDNVRQWNITTSQDEPGLLTRTEIPELYNLNDLKPLLSLSRRLGGEILKSIVEWQTKNGHKTVDQNFTEGKLQATEKHLEDMQKIVSKVLKL